MLLADGDVLQRALRKIRHQLPILAVWARPCLVPIIAVACKHEGCSTLAASYLTSVDQPRDRQQVVSDIILTRTIYVCKGLNP